VKIELPKLLLELRSEVVAGSARDGQSRLERLGFRAWAWLMRRPRLYELAGMIGSLFVSSPEPGKWLRGIPFVPNVGPLKAWSSVRDIPPLPPKSFRQLWRSRQGGGR
jgi:L-lactate dehydrogenase complex protein LldF